VIVNLKKRHGAVGRKGILIFLALLPYFPTSFAIAAPDLSKGIAAFEDRRWSEAMDAFLEVLREDPTNTEAHAYINLIAREMEAKRQAVVRDHRLEMLGDASKRIEANRQDPTPLTQAILDTTQTEKRAQEQKWRDRCEEARMQRNAGHLLAANDLVLQIIAENASFPEAQRELSDLQSQIRHILDTGSGLSIAERYALEGFYAYGQADYGTALTAWGKVRTLFEQSYPGPESVHRLSELHFSAYERIAQEHTDEEKRLAELKTLFDEGVALFQQKHFSRALEEFRKLAIRDPEYPQLGYYLVQGEAAAENERAQRLGEAKRREIDHSLQNGLAALEKEQLRDAELNFENVLRLDPAHPQARSYLAMVRAETLKRHDPKAAQLHYEAGLIAYASGKLDEALREWHMATRLNPQHEKALNALAKVQKELALNREVPSETVP
jgi:tetratricopeptide (TPR) repeat protein